MRNMVFTDEFLEKLIEKVHIDLHEVQDYIEEMLENAREEGRNEILEDPYAHDLVPMDNALEWVADNYRPRY